VRATVSAHPGDKATSGLCATHWCGSTVCANKPRQAETLWRVRATAWHGLPMVTALRLRRTEGEIERAGEAEENDEEHAPAALSSTLTYPPLPLTSPIHSCPPSIMTPPQCALQMRHSATVATQRCYLFHAGCAVSRDQFRCQPMCRPSSACACVGGIGKGMGWG
jgi:hypothetical protein